VAIRDYFSCMIYVFEKMLNIFSSDILDVAVGDDDFLAHVSALKTRRRLLICF
jgi:hypothetical protein